MIGEVRERIRKIHAHCTLISQSVLIRINRYTPTAQYLYFKFFNHCARMQRRVSHRFYDQVKWPPRWTSYAPCFELIYMHPLVLSPPSPHARWYRHLDSATENHTLRFRQWSERERPDKRPMRRRHWRSATELYLVERRIASANHELYCNGWHSRRLLHPPERRVHQCAEHHKHYGRGCGKLHLSCPEWRCQRWARSTVKCEW